MKELEVTKFPWITVRRSVSKRVDESWDIYLVEGEPEEIRMRTVTYVGDGEPVVQSEWVRLEPEDVPDEVVRKVEEHMVPRGSFT